MKAEGMKLAGISDMLLEGGRRIWKRGQSRRSICRLLEKPKLARSPREASIARDRCIPSRSAPLNPGKARPVSRPSPDRSCGSSDHPAACLRGQFHHHYLPGAIDQVLTMDAEA